MLMKERDLGDECYLKEEFIIGRWERGGVISLDSVYLLHEVQGYMARRARGKFLGGYSFLSIMRTETACIRESHTGRLGLVEDDVT
jgi:hypothetical protein